MVIEGGDDTATVRLWDAAAGKLVAELETEPSLKGIIRVAFSHER